MQLFLKPFYCVGDGDTPVDSTKNWQCAAISFAAHAFLFSIAVFFMPVSVLHPIDSPKEKIIRVTMVNEQLGCSKGSGSDAGMKSMGTSLSQTDIQPGATPADPPAPAAEPKPVACPKPVKRTESPVRSRPARIKPSKPETAIQHRPEPAMPLENKMQAAIASENPLIETATASSDSGKSDSGNGLSESGSSENGKHSEGGAGSPHGKGSKLKSGHGSDSGEIAFGSAGGPGFIRRALPRFPKRAQLLGMEGAVVLRLSLDQTGRLTHVEVVSGAGNGFDEEAIRAVQQSTFSPAVRNGLPVNSLALLSIRFNLGSKE